MKSTKFFALAAALYGTVLCLAQPSLSYEKHGLLAGEDNPMSICEYADPGMSGANVTWDFSDLRFKESFIGYLNAHNVGPDKSVSAANTVLREFESNFYFEVNESGIKQYGYGSADGKVVTEYEVPFEKIRYPFSYEDSYSGIFSATTSYQGNPQSELDGDYSVTADAYGTLILPGNIRYENTLRVKTTREYTSTTGNHVNAVELTTYRWYNSEHRFPLLVLTEYTVNSGSSENKTYQSAYNNNAVQNLSPVIEESFALYPNPVSTQLNLAFTAVASGTMQCTLIDPSGRVVRNFNIAVNQGGSQSVSLDEYIAELRPSTYVLRIENGNSTSEHNIIVAGN